MDLDKLKVTKPCHEDWSRMQGDAQRRFCGSCNKHVHDLSAMTRAEAEAVCATDDLCVRYAVDARGHMVHAGALAIGLALSGTALASTNPEPDSVPWWNRAAQAVYDWWWPPEPEVLPPIQPPAPQYEEIEERHFTMGKPAPRKPPPPSDGPVSITLGPGSPSFTSIEVKCEAAQFQQRAPFLSPGTGTATLPGVPNGDCRLSFKGGPFVTMPIHAGDELLCTFVGAIPTCKEM